MGSLLTRIKNTVPRQGAGAVEDSPAESVLAGKIEKKFDEAFEIDFRPSKKFKSAIRKGKCDLGLVVSRLMKSIEAEKKSQCSASKEDSKAQLKQSGKGSFLKYWKRSRNVLTGEKTSGDSSGENVLAQEIDNIIDEALKIDFQPSKKFKREIAKGKCDLMDIIKRLLESVQAEKEAQWSASKDKTKLFLKTEIRRLEKDLKRRNMDIESLRKKCAEKTHRIELNSEKIDILEKMLWECYFLKLKMTTEETDMTRPEFVTGVEDTGDSANRGNSTVTVVDGGNVPVEQGLWKNITGRFDYFREQLLRNREYDISFTELPSTIQSNTGNVLERSETVTSDANGGVSIEQDTVTVSVVDTENYPVKQDISPSEFRSTSMSTAEYVLTQSETVSSVTYGDDSVEQDAVTVSVVDIENYPVKQDISFSEYSSTSMSTAEYVFTQPETVVLAANGGVVDSENNPIKSGMTDGEVTVLPE